jgi:hypothetical protein
MEAKTWGQMRSELRNELNLGDQGLVEDPELMVMANRGLQFAESEIHSLNEDYFRTHDVLTLVDGISTYNLPSGIYGAKLRKVLFDDGTTSYEVCRIRNKDIGQSFTGQRLHYELDNSSLYGMRMAFSPSVDVTGPFIKRWYLRRAKVITSDDSVVDLAEFSAFIYNYVKVQVLLKSDGVTSPALLSAAQAELQMARDLMVRVLSSIVVDEDEGEIDLDMSFFHDSEV